MNTFAPDNISLDNISLTKLKEAIRFKPSGTAYSNINEIVNGLPDNKTLEFKEDSTNTAKIEWLAKKAKDELNEYLTFPNGWDGYHGEKFEKDLINEIKNMLYSIELFFKQEKIVPSEITPGPASDGSIDLEICCGRKCLILTLYPNDNVIKIYSEDMQGSREEEFFIKEFDLGSKLLWLAN